MKDAPRLKPGQSSALRAAAEGGVDWRFYRLAFSEFTRAPVEVHMMRPLRHVYTDFLALDAMDALRALEESKFKR